MRQPQSWPTDIPKSGQCRRRVQQHVLAVWISLILPEWNARLVVDNCLTFTHNLSTLRFNDTIIRDETESAGRISQMLALR